MFVKGELLQQFPFFFVVYLTLFHPEIKVKSSLKSVTWSSRHPVFEGTQSNLSLSLVLTYLVIDE